MKMPIKIGKLSIYLLFPLFTTIFWVLRALVLQERNKNNFSESFPEFKSPLFFSFFSIIIYLLGGPLELLSRCLSKRSQTLLIRQEEARSSLLFTKVRSKVEVTKKEWSYFFNLLLFAAFTCIRYPFVIIFSYSAKGTTIYNEMKVGHILMVAVLSFFILRYYIFKHHIVSSIIIISGMILIFYQNLMDYPVQCLFCLLVYFFYAFPDVQLKKVTNAKPNSIFIVMFYEGVLILIILILFSIVAMFTPCFKNDFLPCNQELNRLEDVFYTFKTYFNTDTYNRLLIMTGYNLAHFGYITFFFLTIYYFTPLHRGMADTFSVFLLWIINLIRGNAIFKETSLLGYLIICIGVLIYNEIIILDFCSLEVNTKEEIAKRSKSDSDYDNDNDTLISLIIMDEVL